VLVPVRASPVPSVVRGSFVVKFTFSMEQEPYVWLDLVSGKHYVCDRLTGDKIACTAKGKPLPKFKPGVSGVVKAQARSQAGEPVCS